MIYGDESEKKSFLLTRKRLARSLTGTKLIILNLALLERTDSNEDKDDDAVNWPLLICFTN